MSYCTYYASLCPCVVYKVNPVWKELVVGKHTRTRTRARARAHTHTHMHTHARTHTHTHARAHTHTHTCLHVEQGDSHGCEKDSLEIVTKRVHLEGGFKRWGRIRVAECLGKNCSRQASVRKGSFIKCFVFTRITTPTTRPHADTHVYTHGHIHMYTPTTACRHTYMYMHSYAHTCTYTLSQGDI